MNEPGLLVILSGPSGSGKGTIVKRLLEERDDTVLSVSAATRAPRPGEIDGVHYHFMSRDRFQQMVADHEFLEWAEYNGNFYGTPEHAVTEQLRQGKNVLLEIEVQGAEQILNRRTDAVSIFLTTPSMEELERRLRGRGTETEESIAGRLAVARRELSRAFRYDYIVPNDEVDCAVRRIQAIMQAEKLRYSRMEPYIMEVQHNA